MLTCGSTQTRLKPDNCSRQALLMLGPRRDRGILRPRFSSAGNLARKKFLTPASTPRSGFGAALWSATHRGAFEFSRRSPRTFLSAIKGVAEHSGNGILSPQKVHLKAVRLFFGARLRVDAADVRFRIGIGSSSHE